jgi:formate dehydrogenase assembly factor FdhD
MSNIYVVKNQHGLFASKHKEWLDGREPKLLFRSPHKDEAINIVFELSSKDINTRAEAISVEIDSNKQPVVEVTAPPPPPKEDDESPQQQDITSAEQADSEKAGEHDGEQPSETAEPAAI